MPESQTASQVLARLDDLLRMMRRLGLTGFNPAGHVRKTVGRRPMWARQLPERAESLVPDPSASLSSS